MNYHYGFKKKIREPTTALNEEGNYKKKGGKPLKVSISAHKKHVF